VTIGCAVNLTRCAIGTAMAVIIGSPELFHGVLGFVHAISLIAVQVRGTFGEQKRTILLSWTIKGHTALSCTFSQNCICELSICLRYGFRFAFGNDELNCF